MIRMLEEPLKLGLSRIEARVVLLHLPFSLPLVSMQSVQPQSFSLQQ